jgi:hypothetical protein
MPTEWLGEAQGSLCVCRITALHYSSLCQACCEDMKSARQALQAMLDCIPDWKTFDQYRPFPVRGKLPVASDLFGPGNVQGAALH